MPKYKCGDQVLTLDRVLAQNLSTVRNDLQKDRDSLIIVDGYEGSGKSTITFQMAKFVDHDFDLDNIVFTPEEFKEKVMQAKKGTVIVYDEAVTGSRAASWAKDINKALVEMMAQVRQKNLCIFMIIPTFYEMQKYYAIHRSRALVHVYNDRRGKRGYFQVYNRSQKTRLYVMGKKSYSYSPMIAKWNFHGKFTKAYTIDEEKYREKKLKAFIEGNEKGEEKESVNQWKWRTRLSFILQTLKEQGWTLGEIEQVYSNKPRDKWGYKSIATFLQENLKENAVFKPISNEMNEEGLEAKRTPLKKPQTHDFKANFTKLRGSTT